MKSGLNSDRYEKNSRFQPSKWEKLQVRRLLHRLKCGSTSMDFSEGKVRDMNDLADDARERTTVKGRYRCGRAMRRTSSH